MWRPQTQNEFSYCVFLEQLLRVSSFCQTILRQPENLLQLHSRFVEPFHEAAVGLHVLPPLRRFLYQGLHTQTVRPSSLLTVGAEINGREDIIEFAFGLTCEEACRSATLFCRRLMSRCCSVLLPFIIFWMVWWFFSITVKHFLQLCVKVASSCKVQCRALCQPSTKSRGKFTCVGATDLPGISV